jgi:hypothetical protein
MIPAGTAPVAIMRIFERVCDAHGAHFDVVTRRWLA